MKVYGVARGAQTSEVGLNDWLIVEANGLSEPQRASARTDKSKVALFLNDTPLKGLCTGVFLSTNAAFRFHLDRADATRSEWTALLGRPQHFKKLMHVSIGFEGGPRFPVAEGATDEITFIVIHQGWFWFCLIASVFLIVAVLLLARKSQALRDDGPSPPGNKLRPYSLARCQMAFWFVLVIPAFLFLWLITGALDTLTESILVLMGISASTAVFAHAQYGTKQSDSAVAKLQKRQGELRAKSSLTDKEKKELDGMSQQIEEAIPKTDGFISDVLTDDVGMSFHRFQMFVWTIVMGIIYFNEVYQELAMPDFSGTLLGLMGISSGTYLGFMLTEKPSAKQPEGSGTSKNTGAGA